MKLRQLTSTFSLVLFSTAVLSIGFGSTAFGADEWPRFRGPKGDGHSSDKSIRTNWSEKAPKLLWTADGLGKGYASVSISGDTVFSTGNKNGQRVVALKVSAAGKASELWSRRITDQDPKHGYDGSRTTPALDGEHLYVVASSGAILCLKQSDGAIVWQKDFKKEWGGRMMSGWGYSESPLVDGDHVLCTPGGSEAMIVCLNKKTGAEVWKSAVPKFSDEGLKGAGYSSLSVSNAGGVKQYVQLIGRGVIGVRASDGKFLWGYGKVANRTAAIPNPVVFGDQVFASTAYNTGSALLTLSKSGDGVEAKEEYFLESGTLQNKHGGMVLVDGHIYCGHGNGSGIPTCVNVKTGKVTWKGRVPDGRGESTVLSVGGNVIFRFENGVVAVVKANPEKPEVLGRFVPTGEPRGKKWAHPVVVGGRLYLRSQDKLFCYDVSK